MKNIHVLVIVLFGLFLAPSYSFACEKRSAKQTSTKETSSKIDNDDCCKNGFHSKTKNHKGCGGKCNHSKCGCASFCSTSISINEWDIDLFNFSSKRQTFFNRKASISSGFNSLWFIPKIS